MYSKRAKLLKESEAAQWEKIVYRYMTEESDDSDSDGIVRRHKLEWRSTGNGSYGFVCQLDAFYCLRIGSYYNECFRHW